MKVVWQEWQRQSGGPVFSISKDYEQYRVTVQESVASGEPVRINEEPWEVDIPDDHPHVETLKTRSVFLEHGEMEFIEFPSE